MPLGKAFAQRMLRRAGRVLLSVPVVLVLAFLIYHQVLTILGATPRPVAEVTIAGRRVAMWKPEGAAPPAGYPVIVFSHGFTGCGTQSVFLTEALAHAGYLVLAPNHFDAGCGTDMAHQGELFAKLATTRSEKPFHRPEMWSDSTYRNRYEDVEAVLDTVLKDKTWEGMPVDGTRVGLAGHSLGGYTALGLAGAWPAWKDARVKAVLALSPYCTPFLLGNNLSHLGVPVMYQGGTMDLGVSPDVRRPGGAYELTAAPKYFVDLAGAGHFSWTNLNKTFQPVIDQYSVAFFDHYLKATEEPDLLAPLLARPWPKDVKDIQFATR